MNDSSNAQKTPLARSLEAFASRKARGEIELTGQSLPASVVSVDGAIATVRFELTNLPFTLPQIRVPILGSEYVRLPIQPGCKGFVVAADAYLGGMSGLGGGTADLSPRPNLSNLVFVPVGNSGWSASEDPDAVVIYGPNGVVIRDTGKNCTVTVGQTQITVNGKTEVLVEVGTAKMTMTSAGTVFDGPVTFNQPVTMEQTLHVVGALSAASAAIVGAITAASATLSGALVAASGAFSGLLTALNATITGALSGGTVAATAGNVTASGNLVGGDMQVAGHVPYSLHEHGGVQNGGGFTGTPN